MDPLTSAPSPFPSILICGAGIFGTSTAYHLSLSCPSPASVIIVDNNAFPPPPAASVDCPPLGASYDINKIIRADYSTPFYMDIGHEAIDAWSSSSLLKPFYHQTGWVMLDRKGSDLAERIRKNFRECGRKDPTSDISRESIREAWDGILREANLEDVGSAYWNPEAGWAEADKAIEAMLREVTRRGVQYVQGSVVELLLHESPARGVRGVKLASGQVIEAKKVVLATGAWTSQLTSKMEDRLNIEEKDRIEQQVKAAGVCVAHFELTQEEKKRYDQMPVIINGEYGDIQPPPGSRLLKFTNGRPFTNNIITGSNRVISAPPTGPQAYVPQALKTETLDIVNGMMPSIQREGRPVAYWRLCWDSITPTQDQLITRHPDERLNNLFMAVGGSFHSWKFLPVIGKYVANVINGVSNGIEKDSRWEWKRTGWSLGGSRGAHEKAIPQRELLDMERVTSL